MGCCLQLKAWTLFDMDSMNNSFAFKDQKRFPAVNTELNQSGIVGTLLFDFIDWTFKQG